MRKEVLLVFSAAAILLGAPGISLCEAPQLEFRAPAFDTPHYAIYLPLEVQKTKTFLSDVRINGKKWSHYLIFKDGKYISSESALEPGKYDVIIDYAWKNSQSYAVTLTCKPEGSEKAIKFELKGNSPGMGGLPGGEEGFYRISLIEEEVGLERTSEIICLTLTAPKDEVDDGRFIFFNGNSELPYQVLERREAPIPEKAAKTNPPTLTFKIALPINALPFQKKMILALKGDASLAPANEKGFVISGEGLGKTVKGSRLSLGLHSQSGQVNTIEHLKEGIKLFNKAGVIHWNPDVFIPTVAWDHSFDWNPPLFFEEKIGDLLYINTRRGPMQRIKDVELEVKYLLEADAPYFISETRMTMEKDLGVIAVRNDEMVLSNDLFDSLVYIDKKEKVIQMPLREKAGYPFGLVEIGPADADWVGLVNTKEKYGFFSLRLNAASSNLSLLGGFPHHPGTYFYAPSDGNYVYWVRPLIYTWADYLTNSLLSYVPQGSFFYEKNAYLLVRLNEDFPEALNTLLKKLRNPLRIY